MRPVRKCRSAVDLTGIGHYQRGTGGPILDAISLTYVESGSNCRSSRPHWARAGESIGQKDAGQHGKSPYLFTISATLGSILTLSACSHLVLPGRFGFPLSPAAGSCHRVPGQDCARPVARFDAPGARRGRPHLGLSRGAEMASYDWGL